MGILWTILIGAVIGVVARFVKPGADSMGWIMTILFGIGGSFVASYVGSQLGLYPQGGLMSFIASVVGAVVLLFIYGLIFKKN